MAKYQEYMRILVTWSVFENSKAQTPKIMTIQNRF
ncbi:hypothetical protein CGBL_0125320 [Corynebacterium glutamicum]|nr:hypothetical protein CGBL_0125320 [Corynebacterium glutamicum]